MIKEVIVDKGNNNFYFDYFPFFNLLSEEISIVVYIDYKKHYTFIYFIFDYWLFLKVYTVPFYVNMNFYLSNSSEVIEILF